MKTYDPPTKNTVNGSRALLPDRTLLRHAFCPHVAQAIMKNVRYGRKECQEVRRSRGRSGWRICGHRMSLAVLSQLSRVIPFAKYKVSVVTHQEMCLEVHCTFPSGYGRVQMERSDEYTDGRRLLQSSWPAHSGGSWIFAGSRAERFVQTLVAVFPKL